MNHDLNHDLLHLYKNASFTDLYGGSIVFTTVSFVIIISVIMFLVGNFILSEIEQDWENKRCQPPYTLFAGMINKDKTKSYTEKMNENQAYCMKEVSDETFESIREPIEKASIEIEKNQIRLNGDLNQIQDTIEKDKSETTSFFENIQTIMKLVALQSQKVIAKLKDSLHKLTAVLTSSIQVVSIIGTMFWKAIYYFKQLLIMIRNYTIGVIIGLTLLIIVLLFSLNWVSAGVTSAFLALVSIFFATIMLFIPAVSNTIETANMQMNSACFDGMTRIKTVQGIYKNIKNIQVGDILEDNSVVTATMKIPYTKKYKMVTIGGIVVTFDHRLFHKGSLIQAKNHPEAISMDVYDTDYLYCLNTNHKTIQIENHTFLDWDDLSYNEYVLVEHNVQKHLKTFMPFQYYFEKGFDCESTIEMDDGFKKVKDIKIGDSTIHNEVILCIIDLLYSCRGEKRKHFITSKGTITICNEVFYDFDREKEYFLYSYKEDHAHDTVR